jgi:tetratricopeptide (TPR) repeat protein
LIERNPNHELATQALVGRASSYRQNQQTDKAIADLERFLQSKPEGQSKTDALYELGLALIDSKDWPRVSQTFQQLLDAGQNPDLTDRYLYELAWAERENKNLAESLTHFKRLASDFPNSPLAPESNFHIAQDAYERQAYAEAIPHYESCIELLAKFNSTEDANVSTSDRERSRRMSIREKAIYKLAWSHYKQKDFVKALARFRQQVEEFPQGSPLYADGLFMVSETLFENNQTEEALQAYRAAKPVIETSESVKRDYRILTLLHGAQSANKTKQYQVAIDFARPLLEMDVDASMNQDAHMELGDAYRGLKELDTALGNYEKAALHPGKTGARSRCMIGEIYFEKRQFTDAIDNYKLVCYGYGGKLAPDDVRAWQAYARYEAGRCNHVQIATAENEQAKSLFINESIKHFKQLIEDYPTDPLASKAQELLSKLEALQ